LVSAVLTLPPAFFNRVQHKLLFGTSAAQRCGALHPFSNLFGCSILQATSIAITVDGRLCPLFPDPSVGLTSLLCTTPFGIGNPVVLVTVGGFASTPSGLLRYSTPAVQQVIGCDPVPGHRIAVQNCSRTTSSVITIRGPSIDL
jgi:hypothetical protein